nr:hypothetical protein [Paenibacillus larvae]
MIFAYCCVKLADWIIDSKKVTGWIGSWERLGVYLSVKFGNKNHSLSSPGNRKKLMKKQDNKNLEAVSDIRPSLIDETTGSIFAYKLLYIGIFTLPKRRVDMLSLYGILFGLGMLLALLTLLFGEVLGHLLSGLDSLFSHSLPFLQPVILIGGITILGGTGLLLERYTSLDALPVFCSLF